MELKKWRDEGQRITISSLRADSISCLSLALEIALSQQTCLLPRFKMGKMAPFAESLWALRDANWQLLSSSSATVLSNSPLKKTNQRTTFKITDKLHGN